MKYLKRFNESLMNDYEDFLFSFFDKDPSFIDQSDNWLYVEYNQFVNPSESLVQADIMYEKLKRYLSGSRFADLIIKSEMEYGDFYVLVVNKEFYNKHIKVEDLKWEQHDLAKNLYVKNNIELQYLLYKHTI